MKTTLNDFRFKLRGYGHYLVTYTSPVTGNRWSRIITDMSIIDDTLNEENPRQASIDKLKKIVKRGF